MATPAVLVTVNCWFSLMALLAQIFPHERHSRRSDTHNQLEGSYNRLVGMLHFSKQQPLVSLTSHAYQVPWLSTECFALSASGTGWTCLSCGCRRTGSGPRSPLESQVLRHPAQVPCACRICARDRPAGRRPGCDRAGC